MLENRRAVFSVFLFLLLPPRYLEGKKGKKGPQSAFVCVVVAVVKSKDDEPVRVYI